ncbi:hypothetical protein [Streptomyces sp. NPDC048521]|uniref:hypothetical protein n=1 Tax=Streptomyces sp. NPDC048521 TaxID=3365566 RepID=UPI00371A8518
MPLVAAPPDQATYQLQGFGLRYQMSGINAAIGLANWGWAKEGYLTQTSTDGDGSGTIVRNNAVSA